MEFTINTHTTQHFRSVSVEGERATKAAQGPRREVSTRVRRDAGHLGQPVSHAGQSRV